MAQVTTKNSHPNRNKTYIAQTRAPIYLTEEGTGGDPSILGQTKLKKKEESTLPANPLIRRGAGLG